MNTEIGGRHPKHIKEDIQSRVGWPTQSRVRGAPKAESGGHPAHIARRAHKDESGEHPVHTIIKESRGHP